jgi:hypothetical protein
MIMANAQDRLNPPQYVGMQHPVAISVNIPSHDEQAKEYHMNPVEH